MQIILNEIYNVPVGEVHYSKSSCIEGQDYKIEDLLARWSQGQRLNVNMRPLDLEDDAHPSESENDPNPPIFEDIVDLHEFAQQTKERKTALTERLKQAKEAKEEASKKSDIEPDAS